jgi:hypothetical protein
LERRRGGVSSPLLCRAAAAAPLSFTTQTQRYRTVTGKNYGGSRLLLLFILFAPLTRVKKGETELRRQLGGATTMDIDNPQEDYLVWDPTHVFELDAG